MRRSVAALLLMAGAAQAAPVSISVVIDDMGDRPAQDHRVIALPGPVACAILPNTPHGPREARMAREAGKEVLLHFPLESQAGRSTHPMAVTLSSSREELRSKLQRALTALPGVSGINIHQGSLLSEKSDRMAWMMAEIRTLGGLYFVDSYTSAKSVAWDMAERWQIPSTRRQVFLDNLPNEAAIRSQLERTIALARKTGTALAIGHPYAETLRVLETELPKWAAQGIKLVAPSELIRIQNSRRPPPRNPPVWLRLSDDLALANPPQAPAAAPSH